MNHSQNMLVEQEFKKYPNKKDLTQKELFSYGWKVIKTNRTSLVIYFFKQVWQVLLFMANTPVNQLIK